MMCYIITAYGEPETTAEEVVGSDIAWVRQRKTFVWTAGALCEIRWTQAHAEQIQAF